MVCKAGMMPRQINPLRIGLNQPFTYREFAKAIALTKDGDDNAEDENMPASMKFGFETN